MIVPPNRDNKSTEEREVEDLGGLCTSLPAMFAYRRYALAVSCSHLQLPRLLSIAAAVLPCSHAATIRAGSFDR